MADADPDSADSTSKALTQSINRHIWGAGLFILLLLVLMVVVSSRTQISGAVMATGTFVVESSTKSVKHKEGGVVSEILVRNGDRVKAG